MGALADETGYRVFSESVERLASQEPRLDGVAEPFDSTPTSDLHSLPLLIPEGGSDCPRDVRTHRIRGALISPSLPPS
jgi:hypothetical protein